MAFLTAELGGKEEEVVVALNKEYGGPPMPTLYLASIDVFHTRSDDFLQIDDH